MVTEHICGTNVKVVYINICGLNVITAHCKKLYPIRNKYKGSGAKPKIYLGDEISKQLSGIKRIYSTTTLYNKKGESEVVPVFIDEDYKGMFIAIDDSSTICAEYNKEYKIGSFSITFVTE